MDLVVHTVTERGPQEADNVGVSSNVLQDLQLRDDVLLLFTVQQCIVWVEGEVEGGGGWRVEGGGGRGE